MTTTKSSYIRIKPTLFTVEKELLSFLEKAVSDIRIGDVLILTTDGMDIIFQSDTAASSVIIIVSLLLYSSPDLIVIRDFKPSLICYVFDAFVWI
jgi:hypothetical protein